MSWIRHFAVPGDYDIERRRTSQPASGRHGAAAESHQTRQRCGTEAPYCARQAKAGKEASSTERRPKSQKAAKQANPAADAREGSKAAKVLGNAEAAGRRFVERANESYRLVGAFCPWVPERNRCQADEPRSRVQEEGGRRSPLLCEKLIMPVSSSDGQEHRYLGDGLAPYSEVLVRRRRFYLALAAVFALLALM